MFSFLKSDPAKKLQKKYEQTMARAMTAQRSGDIRKFAEISAEAEAILKKLNAAKADG